MARSPIALTEDLVARTRRAIADAGPTPGLVYMVDADYVTLRDRLLEEAGDGPIRLFAYGSLLWKPGCEVTGGRRAVARGWHRSFCFRVQRFRGTLDTPGLMMALDRGGTCHGVEFEVAEPRAANLEALLRREMTALPAVNVPRWLRVEGEDGPGRALGFVVDQNNPRYVGKLPKTEIATIVASAAGHWGSCAEYLFETVRHLEACGIHDGNLWHLQALVAAEIERLHPAK